MQIVAVSLNYRRVPVQLRERFAITSGDLPESLHALDQEKGVLESVIIGTCNRTEVFAVVDQADTGHQVIESFLSQWFAVKADDFHRYVDRWDGNQAIQHLFELAVGLDSMVLGETQILGQVKEAFKIAQESGTTGTIFNTLFKKVITLAKKAHSETEIGQNAVSVSYAAIELAKKIYGELTDKSVLIIGAGKMSELTAKHLHANGVAEVMVVNRTLERARELSARFNGKASQFEELIPCLQQADIVISSTGANQYVVTQKMVKQVLKKRQDRPLFLIDIAVPRDLEPAIHHLDNAFLYDIDDLNGIVQTNMEERKREALKVRGMIATEIEEFNHWLVTLGVVPMIAALRKKALNIQEETMQSIINKCPDLDERELAVISKHTKSIVNQLMKDPILRIKEMAAEPNANEAMQMFASIFALEEELAQQREHEEQRQIAAKKGQPALQAKPNHPGKELSVRW